MGAQNIELRDQPAYTLSEAARYLKLPAATLRSWTLGRSYPTAAKTAHFKPLIRAVNDDPTQLSFYNLIEAHVLRSLRVDHGVGIKEMRDAVRYAESSLKIARLLLHKGLCAHAGEVFLDKYGELLNLSRSGQLAMRRLLAEHLKRVEWDQHSFPIRLYPFVSSGAASEKPIAIDPFIAFGRPIVLRAGVSTHAIAGRLDAGESVDELAEDYGLTGTEIEEAALYERAA
ncbi:MAG: hypothetical protein QOK37_3287 [Thermoanaerobaculia bacterium]|jgi:uncharacterized protein (DUF433 family)|nr:hypothetical protein [Thermoanaerobaculia bacterium]